MEEKLMKIGEIAAYFSISVKAIRIYEKKGIIIPVKIDPDTGYRYYTVEQVRQLNALLELKAIGFSLNEIKNIILGAVDNVGIAEALKRKRLAWQDAIFAAENKIQAIDKIGERMLNSQETEKIRELTDEERAWLLVKMVCVEDLGGRGVLTEALWL